MLPAQAESVAAAASFTAGHARPAQLIGSRTRVRASRWMNLRAAGLLHGRQRQLHTTNPITA